MARQVLENGVILPAEYSDDWYDDMSSNLTKLDDVIGSDSEKLSSADVGAAALSNSYNDLDNLPTIPTVNDATLTIQKNGVDVQTFTANASSNVTANITVPTKTSDLTNDSNYVDTSNSAVASGITSAKVTSYDSHIADTDIHVTTADKNKWNNNTYVLRYSSSSVTDNSTIAYSTLDNTDNLKVGDKVIDSSGVIYSVTAIDTANSTFTIGTALIDLAQDSEVVHKSGNETISGVKTFTDSITFSSVSIADVRWKSLVNQTIDLNDCYITRVGTISGYYSASVSSGSNISNKAANTAFIMLSLTTRYISVSDYQIYQIFYGSNNEKYTRTCSNGTWTAWNNDTDKFVTTDTNQTITGTKTFDGVDLKLKSVAGEYTVSSGSSSLLFYDKNSLLLSQYKQGVFGSGISYQNFSILGYDSNNQQLIKSITFSSSNLNLSTAYLRPDTDNAISLGRSSNKWSDVQTYKLNGLTPSSLSMPDIANKIDISSYVTDLTGGLNTYIPPANGWICIQTDNSSVNNYIRCTYDVIMVKSSGNGQANDLSCLIPVIANTQVGIRAVCTTLSSAYFIPCQGNV